jgi:hypothetical protein
MFTKTLFHDTEGYGNWHEVRRIMNDRPSSVALSSRDETLGAGR